MSDVDKEFHIRTNGSEATVSLTLGDQTCTFTYNCTGGTGERWKISAVNEDGVLSFFIGKPNPPSYLIFSSFSVTITPGGELKETEVWDNSGVLLHNDQYVIENGIVKQSKAWGGNLTLINLKQ